MVFSSTIFIFIFLPFVLFIYYTLLRKHRTLQNIWLFISSIIFYAWGEPFFVLILLLSILINWLIALFIDKFSDHKYLPKILLIIAICVNISILFIFKYLGFSMRVLDSIAGFKWEIPKIVLPIGISFFTFQALSYVVDIYRKNNSVQKNPLNVGLYIAFFPQLVAGPIIRYSTIEYQIMHRKETFARFAKGVSIFIIGLAKKVLIANQVAVIADKIFSQSSSNLSSPMAWLGIICYTLQIYYDFSGYSDMAIGLSAMFGFKFPKNFDYPYSSTSISEFWRRWHISLGMWFRDYVYFPLGGSRVKSKLRLVFNLGVVWFLTGIWHGANWTFLVWGIFYFVLISFEKLTNFGHNITNSIQKIFFHIYTLMMVMLGWVLFRASSIKQAFEYIVSMFSFKVGNVQEMSAFFIYIFNIRYVLFLGILLSFPIFLEIQKRFYKNKIYQTIYSLGLIIIFLLSISYIIKGGYNPFIYFNF